METDVNNTEETDEIKTEEPLAKSAGEETVTASPPKNKAVKRVAQRARRGRK